MENTSGDQKFMNNWSIYEIRRRFLFAPTAIIEDVRLSAQAKILFITINSFCKKFGYCFASNEILSEKIGLKKTMLKKYLKELKDNQIIEVTIHPLNKHPRRIYIDFQELMKRYPKLPVNIPSSCKLSAKAAKILGKR
ncbi:MAG: helix-turn-helix domain-containing protein [Bacteroidota bacterium]